MVLYAVLDIFISGNLFSLFGLPFCVYALKSYIFCIYTLFLLPISSVFMPKTTFTDTSLVFFINTTFIVTRFPPLDY